MSKNGKSPWLRGCLWMFLLLIGLVGWWGWRTFFAEKPPIHTQVTLTEKGDSRPSDAPDPNSPLPTKPSEKGDRQISMADKAAWLEKLGKSKSGIPEGDVFDPSTPGQRLLRFQEQELNDYLRSLAAKEPEKTRNLKSFHVSLLQDAAELVADVILPDQVPLLGGKSARFHGRLELTFNQGEPDIRVTKLNLGGLPIPNRMIKGMKNKNFVPEWKEKDPEGFAEAMQRLDDVRLEPGMLILDFADL